jgi:hypothetical protein
MKHTPRKIAVEFIEEQPWPVEVHHDIVVAIADLLNVRVDTRRFRPLEIVRLCEVRP